MSAPMPQPQPQTRRDAFGRRLIHVRIHNPVMGVPITFLGKHNAEQFEIVGSNKGHPDWLRKQHRVRDRPVITDEDGEEKNLYERIFIRHPKEYAERKLRQEQFDFVRDWYEKPMSINIPENPSGESVTIRDLTHSRYRFADIVAWEHAFFKRALPGVTPDTAVIEGHAMSCEHIVDALLALPEKERREVMGDLADRLYGARSRAKEVTEKRAHLCAAVLSVIERDLFLAVADVTPRGSVWSRP